jgi:hypothetical protein
MDANGLNEAVTAQCKSRASKPGVEWRTVSGKECLFVRFGAYFTQADANITAQKWKAEFNKKPWKNIVLVWECLEMQGYEKEAREIWQKAINEYKKRIGCIYIITKSNLISSGADFMGVFVGIKIIGIKSLAELRKMLVLKTPS